MSSELVTACMFCLLCATHTHCASHHTDNDASSYSSLNYNDEGGGYPTINNALTFNKNFHRKVREIDITNSLTKDEYIKRVFEKFGDGKILNRKGFERLLLSLKQQSDHNHHEDHAHEKDEKKSPSSHLCWSLNSSNEVVTQSEYKELCPKLLYYMTVGGNDCKHNQQLIVNDKQHHTDHHSHHHHHLQHSDSSNSSANAWIYASVSVVLISLCGLLAVAVIPLMQKAVYHGLLQFLVALAVGTLCGDALLHLLPHAMMASHSHSHEGESTELVAEEVNQHEVNLWRGFVAALSIVFFYFIEKCLSLITEWKKRNQRKLKMNTIVRVMREDHGTDEESRVGEKLCKHKYSSYPYCYGEIANSTDGHQALADSEINNISRIREENGTTKTACQDVESDTNKEEVPSYEKQLLEKAGDPQDYTTIILREHETHHHGHAHTHGHVHSAPGSMGSVAWMVVMGDGIHNLTDGLAIGAAFAANIGGGISTAVAVFCHELPHEIGDFAVLLKAGMSAKQAVFYNVLSSLLCFIGMALGVVLGHNDHVKLWVFSGAAGMFLYIALVDMIPELTSSHSKEGGSLCQCLLQLFGLMTGIGIMTIIALYEDNLMTSFQQSF